MHAKRSGQATGTRLEVSVAQVRTQACPRLVSQLTAELGENSELGGTTRGHSSGSSSALGSSLDPVTGQVSCVHLLCSCDSQGLSVEVGQQRYLPFCCGNGMSSRL